MTNQYKELYSCWKRRIHIHCDYDGGVCWRVNCKRYKTKKWFQKAAKVYDDEMLMLMLKYGGGLK
jgi:hypothetical protein